ncbi:MAG TPA: methyltransferase domain-containing protein [Xanthobacteraceae bacterium]|nr:methyltransferase domain-containing protein [Xanthobacteraceae bacterium]
MLQALLEYHWLRPETALWRALDCHVLAGKAFTEPSIDIGCGDGVFSFIRAGGCFNHDYDQFSLVSHLGEFYSGHDIYNSFDDTAQPPEIARPAGYRISVGVDHKPALLSKAKYTGLYRELVEADANKPLPLAGSRFQTIFSNILYWLDDPQSVAREIARIMSPDGVAYIHVPSETFRDCSLYQRFYVQSGDPRWSWLSLIDRNRSNNIKHCHSQAEWLELFDSADLRSVSVSRYLSPLLLSIWDIGLRPISPILIEIANKLTASDRAKMKSKFVSTIRQFAEPIIANEKNQLDPAAGFFLFELRHKSFQ